MNAIDVVNVLIPKLLDMGFIVHRYDSHSTSSIYLKLDYGVACGIRISDHPGKKKYSYRFNVIKDYKKDKVVYKDGLICYFYDYNELDKVLEEIQREKQNKLNKYGLSNYQMYMKNQSQTDLYTRFKKMEVKE